MVRARLRAFPRARRIRKRADFVRIQNRARRVVTQHLLLLVDADSPSSRAGASRIGIVASRKVGGAIARNRGKRLVREAYRRFPELFPARVDVVVILRAGAGSLGLADITAELRSVVPLLQRRAREALAAAAEGRHEHAAPARIDEDSEGA